jgi:hypothetical protein
MVFTADLIEKDKFKIEKKSLKKKKFIPGLTPFTRKRKVNANVRPQLSRKKTVKGKATRKDTEKDIKKDIKEKAAAEKDIIKTGAAKTGIIRKSITGKNGKKRKNDDDSEDFKLTASRRRKR